MKHLKRPEFLLLCLGISWAIITCGQPLTDAQPGGGFSAMLGGALEVIRLNRALAALLLFGGFAWLLLQQNSPVLPKPKMQIALAVLGGLLIFSALLSPYLSQSLDGTASWLVAFGALLLALGAVGRKEGPQIALGVFCGAGAICALKGVMEYLERREVEPTFRIFAGWSNPNAAAGLFLLLIPVALSLAWTREDWTKWLASLSGGLLTCALLLTQSKGGYLAFGIGLAVFVLLTLLWKGSLKKAVPAAASLALGLLLFGGLVYGPRSSPQPAGSGLARITSGGEVEQSAGFRSLLWKSTIHLAKERPQGWGTGAFRFVSGKPGLVTQTVTPHQNYLGLAAEGGILSLIAFAACAFFWLIRVLPGAKAMTEPQNLLRAGVVAGILGAGAHGMVDSTFAYPGFLVLFFALLGVGLQLSADGSAPELMPKPLRQAAALALCFAPLLLVLAFARYESAKTTLLNAVSSRDAAAVAAALPPVEAMAALDGESAYLAGMHSSNEESRLKLLELASKRMPASRVFRALARAQEQAGNGSAALAALNRALEVDPSNMPALLLMMKMQDQQGDRDSAIKTAERLKALESSTVFTVRSLAELVPTETFQASLFLAKSGAKPESEQELLLSAIKGWADYCRLTLPKVVEFSKGQLPYGGQTPETARENLQLAKEALTLIKSEGLDAKDQEELDSSRRAIEEGEALLLSS